MCLKKIFLPIFTLTLNVFISCGNNSSKNNAGTNSNQQKVMDSTNSNNSQNKGDTRSLNTHLPTGIISLNNLPAGVKEFVTKNYPGYKIKSAASDPLCEGGDAIDVAITKSGMPSLSVILRPDGQFVQQEEDVPLSTAPQKISDALKTKYANYTADKQIEKLILADKTVQYLVGLMKGKVSKEVIFSAEGNVVCEGK